MQPIIKVENLGKSYLIGHRQKLKTIVHKANSCLAESFFTYRQFNTGNVTDLLIICRE